MKIDVEYLRRHFATLSDEALLEVNRSELVDAARNCYDDEVAARKAAHEELAPAPRPGRRAEPAGEGEPAGQGEPDWLEDAACACSFVQSPSTDAEADAASARDALEAAGMPCQVAVERLSAENAAPGREYEYRILVPGTHNLEAVSILDRDVFNPKLEAEWRMHFEALEDDDLLEMDSETLCAGLLDRAERLKKAFQDEVARRGLDAS